MCNKAPIFSAETVAIFLREVASYRENRERYRAAEALYVEAYDSLIQSTPREDFLEYAQTPGHDLAIALDCASLSVMAAFLAKRDAYDVATISIT